MKYIGVKFLKECGDQAENETAGGVSHCVSDVIFCLEAAGFCDVTFFCIFHNFYYNRGLGKVEKKIIGASTIMTRLLCRIQHARAAAGFVVDFGTNIAAFGKKAHVVADGD